MPIPHRGVQPGLDEVAGHGGAHDARAEHGDVQIRACSIRANHFQSPYLLGSCWIYSAPACYLLGSCWEPTMIDPPPLMARSLLGLFGNVVLSLPDLETKRDVVLHM